MRPPDAQLVEGPGAVRALRPAWEHATRAADSPFVLAGTFFAWWEAFGDGDPCAMAVREADELTALLPLMRSGRVLRSVSNDHSGPTVPFARDRAALGALLRGLMHGPRIVDLIEVEPTPELLSALAGAARDSGARVIRTPALSAPYIDTASGDLGAWIARHPGWLKRIARYRRQMAREHDLEIVVGGDDVDAVLPPGLAAEASGWKGRAGTAIAQDPTLVDYYDRLARAWAADGALRLSHLALDGHVVAFDLAAERGGRWSSAKTGYDEAHRRLSPGLVLRLSIVERCFADGLAAHDLLGEGADWKDRMATGERGLQRIRIYPHRPAPLARWAWKAHARPRLRAVRDRTVGRPG